MVTKAMSNKGKSNGSNPLEMNTDDIFGMQASFSNMDSDAAVKWFMEVPKDFATNLLRSTLPSGKFRNAVILAWDRYDRWNDERHKKMLINMLISTRADGGRAMLEAMQVAINIMAEQLMLHVTGAKIPKERQKEMERDINRQMQLRSGQQVSNV